jgi:hypothetical protein
MNLTDRIYLGVHAALTLLVCVRFRHIPHAPLYIAYNLAAMVAIVLLARLAGGGRGWRFAHDWLPAVLFITVFEEVSFLSLALRGAWQNPHLVAFESLFFAVPPAMWLHQQAAPWLPPFLEFGYVSFYPLFPVIGGLLWAWSDRPAYRAGFRRLTDALSVGYLLCYATYLLFPTQSPARALANRQELAAPSNVFHSAVGLIQHHAGVHGNAFPSAHIMLAFVVVLFTYRYLPRAAPWVLAPVPADVRRRGLRRLSLHQRRGGRGGDGNCDWLGGG